MYFPRARCAEADSAACFACLTRAADGVAAAAATRSRRRDLRRQRRIDRAATLDTHNPSNSVRFQGFEMRRTLHQIRAADVRVAGGRLPNSKSRHEVLGQVETRTRREYEIDRLRNPTDVSSRALPGRLALPRDRPAGRRTGLELSSPSYESFRCAFPAALLGPA